MLNFFFLFSSAYGTWREPSIARRLLSCSICLYITLSSQSSSVYFNGMRKLIMTNTEFDYFFYFALLISIVTLLYVDR